MALDEIPMTGNAGYRKGGRPARDALHKRLAGCRGRPDLRPAARNRPGHVQGLLVMTSPPSGVQRARHEAASMPSATGRTEPSRNTKLVTPSWKLLKPQAYVQCCPLVVLGAHVPYG